MNLSVKRGVPFFTHMCYVISRFIIAHVHVIGAQTVRMNRSRTFWPSICRHRSSTQSRCRHIFHSFLFIAPSTHSIWQKHTFGPIYLMIYCFIAHNVGGWVSLSASVKLRNGGLCTCGTSSIPYACTQAGRLWPKHAPVFRVCCKRVCMCDRKLCDSHCRFAAGGAIAEYLTRQNRRHACQPVVRGVSVNEVERDRYSVILSHQNAVLNMLESGIVLINVVFVIILDLKIVPSQTSAQFSVTSDLIIIYVTQFEHTHFGAELLDTGE